MDRRLDPRSIVTPYAFAVHPDLLGMPLATPWQRFGAIFIDLIVIGLLTLVGFGPLAILSVALLFWMATRKDSRDRIGKAFKIAVGCLGVSILAVVVIVFAAMRSDLLRQVLEEGEAGGDLDSIGVVDETGTPSGAPDLGDILQGVLGAISLGSAETAEEALPLLTSIGRAANDAGVPLDEVRTLLESRIPEDASWADGAEELIDAVLDDLEAPEPAPEPGAAQETAAEPDAGEEAAEGTEPTADEAAPAFSEAATDALEERNQRVAQLEEDNRDLEEALVQTQTALEEERNRDRTFLETIMGLLDEAGLGFGWGALYLTIAHTLWKGRSIGKAMFRIRVVMINQRPLNWWLSFERAGGYAAGFATGLLGFAQVFWDPNRQAIHDKVSETIVIQEGKSPVPGPWIAEGKAQWRGDRDDPTPGPSKPKR